MATKNDAKERKISTVKGILFSIIIIAMLIFLAELSVRIWAYYIRGTYETYNAEVGSFELIPGQYRSGQAYLNVNSLGFVGEEFPAEGFSGVTIYALGDSCTFGDGDSAKTYPKLLAEKINMHGMSANVVNAGVEGLNSEMALRRFQAKAGVVNPDIVLIYIGWNDLMKSGLQAQNAESGLGKVAAALDSLWLVKGARKLIFYYLRPYVAPPETDVGRGESRFVDFWPGTYADNLRKIIEDVRARGATPVLLTLPTALQENMSQEDLKRHNIVFPYFSEAQSIGGFLDLIDAYNRTVSAIGEEKSVLVIDLASAFDRVNSKTDYFYDTMHTSLKGRHLIVDQVFEALKPLLVVK